MGAVYLPRNVTALATGGRLVVIGTAGRRTAASSTSACCCASGPASHAASLRSRPVAEKAAIVAAVREHVWPLIAAGRVAAGH